MRVVGCVVMVVLDASCGGGKPAVPAEAGPLGDAVPDAGLAPACAAPVAGQNVVMRKIATVGGTAVLVTSPPNDARLFVVERTGAFRIIVDEQLLATPFLDLREDAGGPVSSALSEEMGLLGLAFDPDFATTGELYVFYTSLAAGDNDPSDSLVRYRVGADPNVGDPASATPVLVLPRSRPNHNGGMIEFGADRMLYVGTGDGGSRGDPLRNGQNPRALHGKMLRIDVAQGHRAPGKEYGIPQDNPFADGVAGAPEVFMLGLRNPWRWSFDRATGDMWIGDVGQNAFEEIDFARAGEQAGKNFGWSMFEGASCCATQSDLCQQNPPQQPCEPVGKEMPIDARTHTSGWLAIIGGQVYRGACYPDVMGWYFYTDHRAGGLAAVRPRADGTREVIDLVGSFPALPTSLHADARGELYETDLAGNVYRLEAGP